MMMLPVQNVHNCWIVWQNVCPSVINQLFYVKVFDQGRFPLVVWLGWVIKWAKGQFLCRLSVQLHLWSWRRRGCASITYCEAIDTSPRQRVKWAWRHHKTLAMNRLNYEINLCSLWRATVFFAQCCSLSRKLWNLHPSWRSHLWRGRRLLDLHVGAVMRRRRLD